MPKSSLMPTQAEIDCAEMMVKVFSDLAKNIESKIAYWFDLYHSGQIDDRELERFLKIDLLKVLGAKKDE